MVLQSKINKYPGQKFYTMDGVQVTESIKLGKTKIFTDIEEAEAYARQKGSYKYELRFSEKSFNRPKFYGYGVPN